MLACYDPWRPTFKNPHLLHYVKRDISKLAFLSDVFEILQVPFKFELKSERLNGNSATKKSPNYHSSDLDKVGQMAKLQFGENPLDQLLLNSQIAIW